MFNHLCSLTSIQWFYIQIIISGFRSFKNCEITNLSPGQNVIIGLNGSGKSNIVCAIEFVLTQNYSRLDKTQRQLLICQNNRTKSKTVSAFVVIEFENSEQRFPLNDLKVAIKRQISLTSDQYFVNGRRTTYDEILALLESGGISINNSYYLVKQGIISEISMSSPRYLLDILRTISGAKSFDDKKKKSMKLISESEETIGKMEENIQTIQTQIDMLNIDEDKINSFQRLDKTRRFLVVKLNEIEKVLIERNLNSLAIKRSEITSLFESNQTNLNELEHKLEKEKQELFTTNQIISQIEYDLSHTFTTIQSLSKELCDLNIQCEVDLIEPDIHSQTKSKDVKRHLNEKEELMCTLNTELKEMKIIEKDLLQKLSSLQEKEKNVFMFSNMEVTVKTKNEQNKFINQHVEILDGSIIEQKKLISEYRLQLKNLNSEKYKVQKTLKVNMFSILKCS